MGASSVGKRGDRIYTIAWHDQIGVFGGITSIVFYVCDDCGEAYMAPMYYSFDPANCGGGYPSDGTEPHINCTGNICPECAGSAVDPDDQEDPRRPT